MQSFKRNQIEDAIARILVSNCQRPPPELRTRIKRLLDLDRSIGLAARFGLTMLKRPTLHFSEEAAESETDISFSEYDTFALANGLRFLAPPLAPGLRSFNHAPVHLDLERENARILRQPRDKLFDQVATRARARAGDIAVDNADPVFLTVVSKTQRTPDEGPPAPLSAVCRGLEKFSVFIAL